MIELNKSPLERIDTSLRNYIMKKKAEESTHMVEGVPDYAFSLDCELRKKLMSIPRFYSICKKITESTVTRQIQIINQQAVAVGANQFPEIYKMGRECANKLGIGVPNIFIQNDQTMNAYTIAADDTSPMIVLHSGIVERMTPGELKCVIGHECGHIHNNHSVFKTVISTVLSMKGKLSYVLTAANMLLMLQWTRAGEITADRAALICSDDVEDAINVDAKLLYGGMINTQYKVDIDALRAQLEETLNNPSKMFEFQYDHPSSIRRIFADKEFEECNVFYKWRPDLKKPDTIMRTKEETDARCKKIVNILNND